MPQPGQTIYARVSVTACSPATVTVRARFPRACSRCPQVGQTAVSVSRAVHPAASVTRGRGGDIYGFFVAAAVPITDDPAGAGLPGGGAAGGIAGVLAGAGGC
ncbi:MAG: hypothetical protein M3Y58_14630, partial [Chloroflexota bacterium]|nr:hypothetical protein [Chloroflexota bacterium]